MMAMMIDGGRSQQLPSSASVMSTPDHAIGGDNDEGVTRGRPRKESRSASISATSFDIQNPSIEVSEQAKKEQEAMDKLLGQMENIQVLVRIRPRLEPELKRGCEAVVSCLQEGRKRYVDVQTNARNARCR